MNLTEFLLARIAEDEAVARSAARHHVMGPPNDSGRIASGVTGERWSASYDQLFSAEFGEDGRKAKFAWVGNMGSDLTKHLARHDPARVLAECEAKRQMIETAFEYGSLVDNEWGCAHSVGQVKGGECARSMQEVEETLAPMAAVYADHPDFDEAWRV